MTSGSHLVETLFLRVFGRAISRLTQRYNGGGSFHTHSSVCALGSQCDPRVSPVCVTRERHTCPYAAFRRTARCDDRTRTVSERRSFWRGCGAERLANGRWHLLGKAAFFWRGVVTDERGGPADSRIGGVRRLGRWRTEFERETIAREHCRGQLAGGSCGPSRTAYGPTY